MATAQVRPQYVHLYPALARGQWYRVLEDDAATGAVRVQAGDELVEVAAEHVACRRGTEAIPPR